MPYNSRFLTDLNAIVADIDAGNITGSGQAISKFTTYINYVKQIGRYDTAAWIDLYVDKVYNFGEKFKTVNPTQFLELLDQEISTSTFSEKEILYFLKCEILWNYDKKQIQEDYLINLLKQYVANAEFMNCLGHLKLLNKKFEESIEYYSLAIKINPRTGFLTSKWNAEVGYIEDLIENENYSKAEKIIAELINSKIYKGNFIHHNWIVFLKNRVKDYQLQDIRSKKKEAELKKLLDEEFHSERRKVIELLGLFTAIIAFIFTTVSIAKTFEYEQAINFIICLGLVLIEFAITISIIFHSKKIVFYKDVRLYVILIIAIALILGYSYHFA